MGQLWSPYTASKETHLTQNFEAIEEYGTCAAADLLGIIQRDGGVNFLNHFVCDEKEWLGDGTTTTAKETRNSSTKILGRRIPGFLANFFDKRVLGAKPALFEVLKGKTFRVLKGRLRIWGKFSAGEIGFQGLGFLSLPLLPILVWAISASMLRHLKNVKSQVQRRAFSSVGHLSTDDFIICVYTVAFFRLPKRICCEGKIVW